MSLSRRSRQAAWAAQRGLSLVELMVGVAIGLFVVAGAATVVATQLGDSRRLVVEAQIQQDLRATADIMTRELRRAGQWTNAASAVWSPGQPVNANPNDAVNVVGNSEIDISWSGATALGFRWTAGPPGVLQLKDGAGNWQDLTDKTTLDITNFDAQLVTTTTEPPLACPAFCPVPTYPNSTACWPTVRVRELQLQITGRSVADPNVVRSIVSNVRLRNDQICNNNNPALPPCSNPPGQPLCPT